MTAAGGLPPGLRRDRAGFPLRAALIAAAAVFLASAAANLGFRVVVGPVQLGFPVAIWQAGIGEMAVGGALLAAAVSARLSWAWTAEGLAAAGIAFGLLSERVQGPARDVHVVLVPLVLLGFVLLGRQWLEDRARSKAVATEATELPGDRAREAGGHAIDSSSLAVVAAMAIAALSFAAASLVHAGAVVPLGPVAIADPFPGAAIPEAVIAIVLGVAAATAATGFSGRWGLALGATLFSLLLTLYGLTVTLRSGRVGDVAYHVTVLMLLAAITIALGLPRTRRSLAGNPESGGHPRGQDSLRS